MSDRGKPAGLSLRNFLSSRPAVRSGQGGHVLIIEDDAELVSAACRALRPAGYEVSVAFDGSAGYFTAVGERPDLIILDLDLPGFAGRHMLALLTASPDTARTPVLAITASANVDVDLPGVDDVLHKPYRQADLLARVDLITRSPRRPRRLRRDAIPAA